MDKAEFEERFLNNAKKKFAARASWENALRDTLKFVDKHKIYEYVPYEKLLHSLGKICFTPNAEEYLDEVQAVGMFTMDSYQIFLKQEYFNRQKKPSIFIHELLHALSYDRKEYFDCQAFKKQTAPEIPFARLSLDDELEEEEVDLVTKWLERNGNLLADAKTSRPLRVVSEYGFVRYEEEYSELINQRKVMKATKTPRDYIWLENGMLRNKPFLLKRIKTIPLGGLTEGATELFTEMISSMSSQENMQLVNSYEANVMLSAQLYAIFGESFFEGYWTHSLLPMCKRLDLDENKFKDIVEPMSRLVNSKDEGEIILKMMLLDDIQVDLIKLFERKMLRELAKYRNDFNSPQDMRNAILSAYFDYSKLLHFGIYDEEILNPNFDDVWKQIDSSIKNCFAFGNKLLAKRKKCQMKPYDSGFLSALKNQNFFTYGYISKDLSEITLSDRLAAFEYDYVKLSLDRRINDAKTRGNDMPLGQCAFMLNKGVDQDTVIAYYNGEDVDLEQSKNNLAKDEK